MLIGNLTRDPELRYTPSGTAVCTFGLATNRSWTPVNGGERKEEAEFHRIVAWAKLAELCSQLLFKGRKVYLEGRLQTRSWTSKDGQDRTTTEIVIDNMIILDSKRREGDVSSFSRPRVEVKKSQPSEEKETKIKEKEESVKKSTPEKKEPAAKEVKKEEVKADDIPF